MFGFVSPISAHTHTATRARRHACELGLGINFGAAAACPQNQISVAPKPTLVFDEEVVSPVREVMTAVPEYPPATELCLMVAYGYWDNETRARFYDLYLHEVRLAQFEAFQTQRTDVPVDAVDADDDDASVYFSYEDLAEPQMYQRAKEVSRVKRKAVPVIPDNIVVVDEAEGMQVEDEVRTPVQETQTEVELDEFVDIDLCSPIALSPMCTSQFAQSLMDMPSPTPSATYPSARAITKTTALSSIASSAADRPALTITIPPLSKIHAQLTQTIPKSDSHTTERQPKRSRLSTPSSKVVRFSSIASPRALPAAPHPALKALPVVSPFNFHWPTAFSSSSPMMSSPESSPAPSTPGDDEHEHMSLGKRKHLDGDEDEKHFDLYALKTNLNGLTRTPSHGRKTRAARRTGRVYMK